MNNLLNSSASSHQTLDSGLSEVENCSDPAGGEALIQGVVNQRKADAGQAAALQTGALPDGAALKSDLQTALGYSLTSDRDYLAWATRDVNAGCSPQGAPANAADPQASASKGIFLGLWNPIAREYGFQPRSTF